MSTGISIALIAIGAILTFALEREAEGINLDTVGIILMIVGILGLVVSALFWSSWGPYARERRSTIAREREGPIV
jgi:asparagine N-glycosylation enzyme membrane subunit Stt3